MQKLRWSDLKTWQKVALIDIGLIEVGLFATGWTDLGPNPYSLEMEILYEIISFYPTFDDI